MSAEADAACGAAYCERTNTRNGYRRRGWDTRAGSIGLAIPQLRQGNYLPDWLPERRPRRSRTNNMCATIRGHLASRDSARHGVRAGTRVPGPARAADS
jgi:hypothetical protein